MLPHQHQLMTPGVLQATEPQPEEDDHALDRHLTRQMGCVTGFFHLFDRHHPLASRRPHSSSSKRLPTSTGTSTPSPSPSPFDRSDGSPRATPSPDPPRSSLPAFDFQEGPGSIWKLRDSPRLSLDSRMVPREIRTVPGPRSDGDDPPRRSPGVVARLMGLDALPPELRRSTSAPRLASQSPPPQPPPSPAADTSSRKGDLEMLKEVLEAIQLKGLLRPGGVLRRRDPSGQRDPIVVVRPAPRPASRTREMVSDRRPRTDRVQMDRRPPASRISSPAAKSRGAAGTVPQRIGGVDEAAGSPRSRKPRRISAKDFGSPFDCERERLENRKGKRLLERCDKLLHSIAEITEGGGGGGGGEESSSGRQTSPVSVLESVGDFFGDDEGPHGGTAGTSPPPPAPALKRCLHFEGEAVEKEDDPWMQSCMPLLEPVDAVEAADRDFHYVAKVLRVSNQTASIADKNAFWSLEMEHEKMQPSKVSRLHRRLMFDTVAKIVDRNKRPPSSWEAFTRSRSTLAPAPSTSPRHVWEEVKRFREHTLLTDDTLQKDIVGNGGEDARVWSHQVVELSDVVLDVERLVFKDLVADMIRDLASSNPRWHSPTMCPTPLPMQSRRKLVF